MLPAGAGPGLCRLCAYLEELEAAELKRFKLHVGTAAGPGGAGIPWGRMETAGALEMAQLLVARLGPRQAWLLALGVFERIHRRDLWERGQREDADRGTPPGGPSSPESQSACLPEVCPGAPGPGDPPPDPLDTYRAHVRRTFRLMRDRNARPGESVNLGRRFTRLQLAQGCAGPRGGAARVETLFEADEERPEPPRTVVLQGAAGMGKTMLARKVVLDWADGRLFPGRFDVALYLDCRELSRGPAERSARDLLSGCWPGPGAPPPALLRNPARVLLVLDGLDELRASLSFAGAPGPCCLGWDELRPTGLLLSSLLAKQLLPEASLLVTTRPCALERLQGLLQQPRHAEILGFSEAERERYFHRFFGQPQQAARALSFVRDSEPLFSLCFVPLLCWVVCTCLRQRLEAGELLGPPARTTTAVYTLYLLSLLQPRPGTPTLQGAPNHRSLCSLAAEGLWQQKALFEERDLRRHGLDGADVSAFLNVSVFQKDIGCERLYSFIHLSFQEFFAAMHYSLAGGDGGAGGDGALGPRPEVAELLAKYALSDRSFLALTVRFLFGLLNAETRSYLERALRWAVEPGLEAQLLGWIRGLAHSEGCTLQRGSLELLGCLYETQEPGFIRQALRPFQVVVVSDISTKMEHMACAYCAQSCESAAVLHLSGAPTACREEVQEEEEEREEEQEEDGVETSRTQMLAGQPPESDLLPDAYSEHLAAALCSHRELVELGLRRSALGAHGVRVLCQGLRHPRCQLQNLRLKRCLVPSSACRDLAAALVANAHLLRLDLSGNGLGAAGAALLCAGLRHPRCRLQTLQLRKCALEVEACREIAEVLGVSTHLLELDLTGNALGDAGLRLLCQGLGRADCRLQTLWLKICHLTAAACRDLASALSVNLSLTELDLGLNDLGDPGVLCLCEGLKEPQCGLQTLRLGICRLGPAACAALSCVLQAGRLGELDLSFNDLGDAGAALLGEGLRHPASRLRKLWLDSCSLTAGACEDLYHVLGSSPALTELYLTNNALGDLGVRLLCRRLRQASCRLRVLWLFGMELSKSTHRRLAALRAGKPSLDLGC
ncbi:PREDICTED: NACHT, LRR and PYD domains-containing protein 12 [Chinchilla lanigera]|uniref:NACHT, LRR and PYD domains-containing protein 12 n=1 Tax=Chinchilla lanigera TaxID=34839 RepID=UPI000696E825|nr:PREDICTED: NACHT, LRR and PYD domains-containing protein 12 [Chinchilla lanigera]